MGSPVALMCTTFPLNFVKPVECFLRKSAKDKRTKADEIMGPLAEVIKITASTVKTDIDRGT